MGYELCRWELDRCFHCNYLLSHEYPMATSLAFSVNCPSRSVYVCMHCIRMHICMCSACLQGYLCRSQSTASRVLLQNICCCALMETKSLSAIVLTNWVRWTDQWTPEIYVFYLPSLGLHMCSAPVVLTWMLGISPSSSCLSGKQFTDWVISQPLFGSFSTDFAAWILCPKHEDNLATVQEGVPVWSQHCLFHSLLADGSCPHFQSGSENSIPLVIGCPDTCWRRELWNSLSSMHCCHISR